MVSTQIKKLIRNGLFVVAFLTGVAVMIMYIAGVFEKRLTYQERYGPDAPADQGSVIARSKTDNKLRLLLTKTGTDVLNYPYYIVFNPVTSSDPTMTTFASKDEASAFYNTPFSASPKNKAFSAVSTTALNADYTEIRLL